MEVESLAREALVGAVTGSLATVVMTTLMEPGLPGLLDRRYRPREFVPKQVVRWLSDVTGQRRPRRGSRGESAAAGAAHLAYGAGAGALYAVLQPRLALKWPAAVPSGPLFGLALWAAGYQGWMPAAGVRPATTDHTPTQWPVPIANHMLYGTVLARLVARARAAGLAGHRPVGGR